MGAIENVELVERWVFDDLSASAFSDEERARALAGIDDLEEDLVTWERPLRRVLRQIEHPGTTTVYRRREGDLRLYFVRQESTLYCIGVGKRKTTYDRDLDTVVDRADDLHN